MAPEQMSALADEIRSDPLGLGYAALLPDQPGRVVELLNALGRSAPRERFVTARGLLADLPDGAQVLDQLDAASAQVSAVKWAMKFMLTDGIDVGHPRTRALLDGLAQAGVLTPAQSAAVKALAVQPCSRASELGLGAVDEAAVRAAMEG